MLQFVKRSLLSAIVLASLAACGGNTPDTTEATSPGETAQNGAAPSQIESTDTSATLADPDGTTADSTSATEEATQNGWQTIQGNGLALQLPARYQGGNPKTDLNQLEAQLTAINPAYADRLAGIKENPDAIAFLAFDPQSAATSGFLTNVNIATENIPSEIGIETYMEAAKEQLAALYTLEDSQMVDLKNGKKAGRLVGEIDTDSAKIKQLFYMIQEGEQIWIVTYAATSEEFTRLLPEFEQSIQTLELGS
ncbi:hypothetical protein K4A83_22650 [Spirulina subsalsa FACHB-351]|uniref:DUF1795 domain-containing protein n=1 Tax=Spirulina subsalsa FACHB-351 TaxID=234711 RepID=A0ABT3LD11_9CYAN|nr:hypothetical protein [Spirulina subsalsa]MCW6039027.1 hypothetical protein [Spirulina subsalsa FACHB-351]